MVFHAVNLSYVSRIPDVAPPGASESQDGSNTSGQKRLEHSSNKEHTMNGTTENPFWGRFTIMLSYVYKFAKLGFAFYKLVHLGH
jgi:hypothetical protein